MFLGLGIASAEELSWGERQRQEYQSLKKSFGVEEDKLTEDITRKDKQFMSQAMDSGDGFMEDSISSRLAAPVRAKKAETSDQDLESLVPKSNPFERKRRGR